MADIRLCDLTLGAVCRIGITLSTCFWMPVSLLLGVAGAFGALPVESLQGDATGMVGFVSGFLQGIACSIATDAMLVLGALSLAIASRVWGGGAFVLKLRRPASQARGD
jgi:hypothetical protein